nr:MAG: RNA-dependent RNA polymerase [Hainan closterovirus 2]
MSLSRIRPPLLKLRITIFSAFGVVRSQALPPRKPSLQENLLSYESRNYNFATLPRFVSPEAFGEAMAMNVLRRGFDLEKFSELRDDIIAISEKGVREWLSKRTPEQVKGLLSDLENPLELEQEITRFKLMVKRDAKVKLDSSCLNKHPPAQNIMFHRKAINAIYSPMFDEFKNRVIHCLKKNIFFFTEMPNSTLAKIAQNVLGTEDVYHVGEIDFSKYDKSQDAFIKAFERVLYAEFGFDPELLSIWMEGEVYSEATTLDGQMSFSIDNQRKSGASNTWIGNTVVTLGILSLYYRVDELTALFVSGDDSLMYSTRPIDSFADDICRDLGFETKFMSPSVPYFCSKFMVQAGHKVFFVPDPYKLVVKLGSIKTDFSVSFLHEVFTSFRDLTADYGDERVCEKLAELVSRKYSTESGNIMLAILSIHCIRSNFLSFLKLFPRVTGWKILYGRLYQWVYKNPLLNYFKFKTPSGDAFFVWHE